MWCFSDEKQWFGAALWSEARVCGQTVLVLMCLSVSYWWSGVPGGAGGGLILLSAFDVLALKILPFLWLVRDEEFTILPRLGAQGRLRTRAALYHHSEKSMRWRSTNCFGLRGCLQTRVPKPRANPLRDSPPLQMGKGKEKSAAQCRRSVNRRISSFHYSPMEEFLSNCYIAMVFL